MSTAAVGFSTEIRDVSVSIFATLVLPISVLLLDYYIRSKIHSNRTWLDLVQESGPDCCILSMGTTGAIFVDPKISAIAGVKSPLFAVVLVLFLIAMRVGCIRKPVTPQPGVVDISGSDSSSHAVTSLKFGIWSLLAIFFVVLYGYLAPALQL